MKQTNKDLAKEEAFIPINYNKYILSKHEKRRFLLICGPGLMLISYIFYHSILISLLFSLLAYPSLRFYKVHLIEKRKGQLKDQFRDALYSLSASIAAGRQMSEALLDARDNMKTIYGDESIIVKELSYMAKRIFQSRETEHEVLQDFAWRSSLDDIINFVDIYFTCRATGGDLVKVMTKTSEIIMDKMTIDKEIHTLTAQKRFEAKLLTAIPIIILLFCS